MLSATALALAISIALPPSTHLTRLAELYRAYDLPVPPKGADIYRFTDVGVVMGNGKLTSRDIWVAFGFDLDKKGNPRKTMLNLEVLEDATYDYTTAIQLKPDKSALEGIASGYPPGRPPRLPGVTFAVQCYLRGWNELAETALRGCKVDDKDSTATELLASDAWNYWDAQLRLPDTDRAKIARRLQLILPDLHERGHQSCEEHIDRMKRSMVPSKAKRGSVEALIDELLDISGNPEHLMPTEPDVRIDAIVRLGFDAVPALIEHLNDERLTRSYWEFPTTLVRYPYSVKHFARDILNQYRADGSAEREQKSPVLKMAGVEEWWAEAKKQGEEKYLLERVLHPQKGNGSPPEQILRVIEWKYPERLPDVIAEVLKLSPDELSIDPFLNALERSSLPESTKKRVLGEVKAKRK